MSDFATLLGDGDGPAVMPERAPNIHVARQMTGNLDVAREGETVTLKIGNQLIRFPYKVAMILGQRLMQRAYEAKVLASDSKRILVEK